MREMGDKFRSWFLRIGIQNHPKKYPNRLTPLNIHNLTPKAFKSEVFYPRHCQVDSAILLQSHRASSRAWCRCETPRFGFKANFIRNPHRWRVKPGFSADLSSTHLNAISWYSLDKGVIVLWVYHWVKPIKINLSVIGGLHRHVDEKGRRKHQDPFATEAKEDMTWWTRFIILWSRVFQFYWFSFLFHPYWRPYLRWWSSITQQKFGWSHRPSP